MATVNWAATAGSAKDSFVVEWSKDGRLFAAVDTITATVDTSATGIAYSYADTHVLMGPNYYRLLLIEQNDTSGYSDVKRIDYLPPVYGFHFGPNPATSVLYITLQGASSSPLRVNILDVQGRMLSSWMFPSQGSTLTSMLDISNLAPGSYLLEAITEDSRSTQVFLKQ